MDIYWSSIEYLYLKDAVSYGKFSGGFVYIFSLAEDARDALRKFCDELNSLNLEVKSVEFIAEYDDVPWENFEDQKKHDDLANMALETKSVVCGDFMGYID